MKYYTYSLLNLLLIFFDVFILLIIKLIIHLSFITNYF